MSVWLCGVCLCQDLRGGRRQAAAGVCRRNLSRENHQKRSDLPQPLASVSASVPAEGTRGNWMCVGVLKCSSTWRILPQEAFEKKNNIEENFQPWVPKAWLLSIEICKMQLLPLHTCTPVAGLLMDCHALDLEDLFGRHSVSSHILIVRCLCVNGGIDECSPHRATMWFRHSD